MGLERGRVRRNKGRQGSGNEIARRQTPEGVDRAGVSGSVHKEDKVCFRLLFAQHDVQQVVH